MTRALSGAGTNDAGFSLIDLVVGTVIASIVATLMVSTLFSGQQSERRISDLSASQEDVRRALVEVLQDVRSAEPLWYDSTVTPAADPARDLRLEVWPAGATSPTYIRWHIAEGELRRDVVAKNAQNQLATVATTYRLPGIDAALTGFAYDHRRGPITITPTTNIDWAQLSSCTTKVTVILRAASEGGSRPVTATSQAQLRNRSEPPVYC